MNELGSDNLFECENCGRIWDGAAQCTCYVDDDFPDSCPTTPRVTIPQLSSPPRVKVERKKRKRPRNEPLRECARLFHDVEERRCENEVAFVTEEKKIEAFLEKYPFCACPQSGELIREPVVTPEGITYDKKSLPESFEQNLVPNAVMSTVISSLLETFVV